MRVVLLLVLLFWKGFATAASDPCAKFSDADAYNYCLAGSGPLAHHRSSSRAPENTPDAGPLRTSRPVTTRQSGRRLPSGVVQKPAPRGRVRFQINLR